MIVSSIRDWPCRSGRDQVARLDSSESLLFVVVDWSRWRVCGRESDDDNGAVKA